MQVNGGQDNFCSSLLHAPSAGVSALGNGTGKGEENKIAKIFFKNSNSFLFKKFCFIILLLLKLFLEFLK